MNKKPKVCYGNSGLKPGAKPVVLPKKSKSTKPSMVKPAKKKPSIKPKKDITKIPGFKFGRGTE
jgi:hypothetical protein